MAFGAKSDAVACNLLVDVSKDPLLNHHIRRVPKLRGPAVGTPDGSASVTANVQSPPLRIFKKSAFLDPAHGCAARIRSSDAVSSAPTVT